MTQDIVIVDIISSIISSMKVQDPAKSAGNYLSINYEPGRILQILKSLTDLDNSISLKNNKYPLIAMVMPVKEQFGGGYPIIIIDRIVIAQITNSTDDVFTRYQAGGTFKSILYPCYKEFMYQLSASKFTVNGDVVNFQHTKIDSPGVQPIGKGMSDYVDTIEILNLKIILNLIKTC